MTINLAIMSQKSLSPKKRSITRLKSPVEIQQRTKELIDKVNKAEGVTFKPKTNRRKNETLVDPKSNVLTRTYEFMKNKENKFDQYTKFSI